MCQTGDLSLLYPHLVVVCVELLHALVHIVQVDPQVLERLSRGFVSEELGDGLYRHSRVVEPASECPPQVVVGEMESDLGSERVQDGIVQASRVLPVVAHVRVVLVVAPQEDVSRVLPVGDVLPGDLDDPLAFVQPPVEDGPSVPVEADGPVLPVSASLPPDVEVGFGAAVFDVAEGEAAALRIPEPKAQLQMDDYILQGRLLHIHEGLILILFEPVDVHPHVLGELGVHVHYRIVPEELQVAVEVGDLSLEVTVKFSSGAVFVHDVVDRILIDPERGGIETARFEDPRHAAEAPPAFVAGVFLGVPELGVQELIDTAVGGVDVPGVGLAAVPDIRLGTARTAAVGAVQIVLPISAEVSLGHAIAGHVTTTRTEGNRGVWVFSCGGARHRGGGRSDPGTLPPRSRSIRGSSAPLLVRGVCTAESLGPEEFLAGLGIDSTALAETECDEDVHGGVPGTEFVSVPECL